MKPAVSEASEKHLVEQYSAVAYGSESLQGFMREVLETMRQQAGFGPQDSLLDLGCGRGYFLRYLQEQGQERLCGLEPCAGLSSGGLADCIKAGSFEDNGLADGSFDVVHTCHTLHHIPDSRPMHAIREMLRLAQKYIVIVEINNTNLPMFARSVFRKSGELNAWLYNRGRVLSMLRECDARVLYSANMASGYLSGDTLLHRAMSRLGARPYNITIAST